MNCPYELESIFDGLAHDCGIPITNALEISQFCTKPSKFPLMMSGSIRRDNMDNNRIQQNQEREQNGGDSGRVTCLHATHRGGSGGIVCIVRALGQYSSPTQSCQPRE